MKKDKLKIKLLIIRMPKLIQNTITPYWTDALPAGIPAQT